MVTQNDMDRVHERVTNLEAHLNAAILKLTQQVTKLATIVEERHRPVPVSPWRQAIIRSVVHVGELALVGLFLFWVAKKG